MPVKYVSKAEMVIFRWTSVFKIKVNGKRLYETNSVKYLGIRIDNKFKWRVHIDDIQCVKTVRIRGYSGPHLSAFSRIRTEYGEILKIRAVTTTSYGKLLLV